MNLKQLPMLCALAVLSSSGALAQQEKPAPHPQAEEAMAKIVLEKDFGENLRFHSREVVTMLINNRTPGLNGLMFMRWKGDDPDTEVMASVQWFEKKEDLIKFYSMTTQREDYRLMEFEGTTLWNIGDMGFSWTDGQHFLVSLGGSPVPPREMVKEWLVLIGSKVAEIEMETQKDPAEEE